MYNSFVDVEDVSFKTIRLSSQYIRNGSINQEFSNLVTFRKTSSEKENHLRNEETQISKHQLEDYTETQVLDILETQVLDILETSKKNHIEIANNSEKKT